MWLEYMALKGGIFSSLFRISTSNSAQTNKSIVSTVKVWWDLIGASVPTTQLKTSSWTVIHVKSEALGISNQLP